MRDALHYCRIVLSNRKPSTASVYKALEEIRLALEPDPIYDPEDPWASRTIPNPKLAKKTAQQQEAFGWVYLDALTEQFKLANCGTLYRLPGEGRSPLYTSPPASKPLADEQIDNTTHKQVDDLLDHIYEYGTAAEGINFRVRGIARAIEAKLREKNTGELK
jgi:hypothetical protein